MTPAAEEEPDDELIDMTRRLWVSAVLTVPLFVLAMSNRSRRSMRADPKTMRLAGTPSRHSRRSLGRLAILRRGWQSIVNRHLNMFTLIALGVARRLSYSRRRHSWLRVCFRVVSCRVWPRCRVLRGGGRDRDARIAGTGSRAAGAQSDGRSDPRPARYWPQDGTRASATDGREEDVPIERVTPGDTLRVRPGERVPVDAVVLEGTSAIDESMVTGESIPVERSAPIA